VVRFPAIPGLAIGVLVACGRLAFDPVDAPDDASNDASHDAPGGVVPRCPQGGAGYVSYPEVGRHYRALGQLAYQAAKDMCASDGTLLATVDSDAEAAKIIELSMPGSAWAGVENAGGGEWRRQDGELATYLPWDLNEPLHVGSGAVVELYVNLRFKANVDGLYEWFAYCECVP